MGTNTKAVRSLIGGGLLALAMMLVLCATAWVPSAYADTLVADQGEVAVGGGGYDPEAAVHDLSKYNCDYKEYLVYSGKVVTLEDLGITFYRYDEEGNKVELTSSDYGDPEWYFKAQGRYIDKPYYKGPYYVTLHGKGIYEGSSKTLDFETVDDDSILLASVEGIEPYYMYTGAKIQPKPILVMPDGTILEEGKDYTRKLEYLEPWDDEEVDALQEPGQYLYEFTETSSSERSVFVNTRVFTESERISLEDEGIRVAGLDASYPYSGSAIKPPIIVRDFSGKRDNLIKNVYDLVEGKDYTIAYKDNVKGNTATITITGKGLYKGSLTKTFSITGVPAAKPDPKPKGIDVGKTAKVGGAAYKVTSNAKSTVVYKRAPKNKKSVVIPAKVKMGRENQLPLDENSKYH